MKLQSIKFAKRCATKINAINDTDDIILFLYENFTASSTN
jgi:hypothetical protein